MDYTKLFKTFADKNRTEVVKRLAKGNCCSCDFEKDFDISQPTLAYHLKHIKEAGLATSKKEGTWNKYHLNYDAIDDMIKFLNDIKKLGEGITCGKC